jgi:HK97 family phage portal protein
MTTTVEAYRSPFSYDGPGQHPLAPFLNAVAYDQIFERQLWPSVAISKLLGLAVILPRKVYRRQTMGRIDARDSPYGQLIGRPSDTHNPQHFWGWFFLNHLVHGRAFARKHRDRGGRPVRLSLIHPTRVRYGPEGGGQFTPEGFGIPTGDNRWWIMGDDGQEREIPRREMLVWLNWSPRHPSLGMSRLEPLRDTLENESAARVANKAMWHNGGKPAFTLTHPGKWGNNPAASLRLAEQFKDRHGGVEQWGKPLVLEEGMEAKPLQFDKDLAYIDVRRLNREEVAAAYDIPPPAIQILDRATFSNVREQNRMVYGQTMPPLLTGFEAALDFDLRDGSFGDGPPDFGDAFYAELLVDGVLRGNFEDRVLAYARMIQTGQATIAEVRELENRRHIPGTDRLLVNGAIVPLEQAGQQQQSSGGSGENPAEGDSGDDDDPDTSPMDRLDRIAPMGSHAELVPMTAPLDDAARSTVMGRLSRPRSLDEIDMDRLVEDLDDEAAAAVRGAVAIATYGGCSVAELRQIIKEIGL